MYFVVCVSVFTPLAHYRQSPMVSVRGSTTKKTVATLAKQPRKSRKKPQKMSEEDDEDYTEGEGPGGVEEEEVPEGEKKKVAGG